MAPIAKMYTLGHSFVPPPVHAGGLRYHGMAPIVSLCQKLGIIETRAVHQTAVFKSAVQFARAEGIIPAPEPSHAIKVVIDEALKCKESGDKKTIVLALSGHGHFDLGAYDEYLSGKLTDYPYPEQKIKEALGKLQEGGGGPTASLTLVAPNGAQLQEVFELIAAGKVKLEVAQVGCGP